MKKYVLGVWVCTILLLLLLLLIHRRPTTAILLTTCINPSARQIKKLSVQERISMYMEKIKLYLEHTKYMIYVVESSGYTFPIVHDRLRQLSFVPNEIYHSSSQAEADSILRVYNSGMLDKHRRIIKITGKYFIQDMTKHIEKVPLDVGIMYQKGCKDAWQPSEIFGFKTEYTCSIFEPVYHSTMTMERSIRDVHQRLGTKAYRFPHLRLGGRLVPRADGTLLNQL